MRSPGDKHSNTGIVGDARRSSAALGKWFVDLKIKLGADQIILFLEATSSAIAGKWHKLKCSFRLAAINMYG